MNKKCISMLVTGLMIFSNATSAFAMSNEVHENIQGNSLLIGNYLFELDNNANKFDLNSFISSARSIEDGKNNEVYYKDASGNWFELIKDGSMTKTVTLDKINNAITMRNGVSQNTNPTLLAQSDLIVSPAKFVESTAVPGRFDTEVTVEIKSYNNAKFVKNDGFSDNITTTVDAITGASLVRTAPTGMNMQVTRLNDKKIKLKLIGTATSHAASINTLEGGAENQKDYNNNKIYGDIKFLMLADFFTGVSKVVEGGQYVVLDVDYNDGVAEDRIINVSKTKVSKIEHVNYGVISLNKGSLEEYNFTLNGVPIEPTKVNDNGTIVKFEMNPKEVAEVKITRKDNDTIMDTLKLGEGTVAFTKVIKDEDPDKVLVSGPVTKYVYFLVDYDENGKIRKELEKTTFNTVDEGKKKVDPSVPVITVKEEKVLMNEDWTNNVVLQVEDLESVKSKKWLANIYDVLKDYDKSAESRQPLEYTVDTKEGTITINTKSTPLDERNGEHTVVIKSNSFNDVKVGFELLEKAGGIALKADYNYNAHQQMVFELKGFNYGITNPIYEVWLDDEKLEYRGGYLTLAELVILYDDALPKLTVGKHKLVVKAKGFEDHEINFTLEEAEEGSVNPIAVTPKKKVETTMLKVDAVSAASVGFSGPVGPSGTGSGASSGSSGGNLMMRANIIYDFDHIANAYILKSIGENTPYADRTIEWWEWFTKDAIITDGSDTLMSYQFYTNNMGENGNKYATFKEASKVLENGNEGYTDKDLKPVYTNKPYKYKNMLHDGEIGQVDYFNEFKATDSPVLTVKENNLLGSDIVIKYSDVDKADEWANALVSVKQNSAYKKFEVDTNKNTITLKASDNTFITGKNKYVFSAPSFKTLNLDIEIYKNKQSNVKIKKDENDNVILEGFEKEFLEHVRYISVGGKSQLNDSQAGKNKGGYEINGTQLIIRGKLFGDKVDQLGKDKQLTLKIAAEGYETFNENFTVATLESTKIDLKAVPDYVKLKTTNEFGLYEPVSIVVEEFGATMYEDAIKKIYIITGAETKVLSKADYGLDGSDFYSYAIDGKFFTTAKSYTVKIEADGYEDYQADFNIKELSRPLPNEVKLIKGGSTIDGSQLDLNDNTSEVKIQITDKYKKALDRTGAKILLNNKTELEREKYSVAEEEINGGKKIVLKINTSAMTEDNYTIELKATGYESKTYTVAIKKIVLKAVPAKVGFYAGYNRVKNATEISSAKNVELKFVDSDARTYFTAVTGIKIENGDAVIEKEKADMKLSSWGSSYGVKKEWLAPGLNTITVFATGYNDYVCTVNNKQPILDVPFFVGVLDEKGKPTKEITYTTTQAATVVTNYEYLSSSFSKSITSIKVNDNDPVNTQPYAKDDYEGITIPASNFTEKRNVILIKAKGFKDAEIIINKN